MRVGVIGVQSQMYCFDYYFGVYVLQHLLRHSDNFFKSTPELWNIGMWRLNVSSSLNSDIRRAALLKRNAGSLDLPEPIIPRKRKNPAKYLGKEETPKYDDITEAKLMHEPVYVNATDIIIACITEKFDQPEFKTRKSHKKLLIHATHGREYQDSLSGVLNIYHHDITAIELEAQLKV